jgi:hypothetical protein
MRRTVSSTKVSKAFKNETTGLIYAKKIEDLEKQNFIINDEIKQVKEEIQNLRYSEMQKKRKEDYLDFDEATSLMSGVTLNPSNTLRKNINVNNPTTLKN